MNHKKNSIYDMKKNNFVEFRAGEPRIGVYMSFVKASKIILCVV